MRINLKKPQDRFILSKGHGFLGLLCSVKKFIPQKVLNNFQRDEPYNRSSNHDAQYGIETSNGSLGQIILWCRTCNSK